MHQLTYVRRSLAAASLGVWLAFAPVPVAPVVYFAPITQAQAADFLITYPDEPTLDAVAQRVSGLWVATATGPDGVIIPGHVGDVRGMPGVGEWAMTTPFRWPKPTGETTTDAEGNTVPVMADDDLWHRTFRWNAPLDALAPYLAAGGGTMTVTPATVDPVTGAETPETIVIEAGPIRMESPLPPDTPVRF